MPDDDAPTLRERHLLPALLGYGSPPETSEEETTSSSTRPIAQVVGPPPPRRHERARTPSVRLRGRPITDVFRIVQDVYEAPTPSESAPPARDEARLETNPLPVFRAATTGVHAFAGVHILDDEDDDDGQPAVMTSAAPASWEREAPARVVRVQPPAHTPAVGPEGTRPRLPGGRELVQFLRRVQSWVDRRPALAAVGAAVVFRVWRPTQLPRHDVSKWPQPVR